MEGGGPSFWLGPGNERQPSTRVAVDLGSVVVQLWAGVVSISAAWGQRARRQITGLNKFNYNISDQIVFKSFGAVQELLCNNPVTPRFVSQGTVVGSSHMSVAVRKLRL